MTVPAAGIYEGTLAHNRAGAVAHAFRYPLFMVLLDIDDIPALMSASRLTSHNRWNWASFDDRDHLAGTPGSLRERLAAAAARHGVELPDGPVRLLTHLRYLGYCFNPVSFYYCYDRAGLLRRVLAEVHNTFGGRHQYWLAPSTAETGSPDSVEGSDGLAMHAHARKAFYVSPFMADAYDYQFAFTPPGDALRVHMRLQPDEMDAPGFSATLALARREWRADTIRAALWRYPLMTASVIVGIHWQALRLWLKGVPLVPRPTPTGEWPQDPSHHHTT